jgi:hypothetical protein
MIREPLKRRFPHRNGLPIGAGHLDNDLNAAQEGDNLFCRFKFLHNVRIYAPNRLGVQAPLYKKSSKYFWVPYCKSKFFCHNDLHRPTDGAPHDPRNLIRPWLELPVGRLNSLHIVLRRIRQPARSSMNQQQDRRYNRLVHDLWEGNIGTREFFEVASDLGVSLDEIENALDDVRREDCTL